MLLRLCHTFGSMDQQNSPSTIWKFICHIKCPSIYCYKSEKVLCKLGEGFGVQTVSLSICKKKILQSEDRFCWQKSSKISLHVWRCMLHRPISVSQGTASLLRRTLRCHWTTNCGDLRRITWVLLIFNWCGGPTCNHLSYSDINFSIRFTSLTLKEWNYKQYIFQIIYERTLILYLTHLIRYKIP